MTPSAKHFFSFMANSSFIGFNREISGRSLYVAVAMGHYCVLFLNKNKDYETNQQEKILHEFFLSP